MQVVLSSKLHFSSSYKKQKWHQNEDFVFQSDGVWH